MPTQRISTTVRKKQTIAAAKKLIIKYGSEHITVRKIAAEIGVSEGAIYRHFVSKKEILSLLLEDIEHTLIDDIEANLKNGQDTVITLEDIMLSQISTIRQKQGLSFQIIAEIISLGDKKLSKRAYLIIQHYLERIKNILSEGISVGHIKPDVEPAATSALLFGMMQGLVTLWTLSHYKINIEQEFRSLWKSVRLTILAPA